MNGITLNDLVECRKLFSVSELYGSQCSQVPNEKGVYFVKVPQCMQVEFTEETTAIREYLSRCMLYPREELVAKYDRADKNILYIGRAIGERSRLRQRIRTLVRYAHAEVCNHRGGRALWQIKNSECLLAGFFACDNASDVEARLLHAYRTAYSVLPVANWQLPASSQDA